MQAVKIEPLTEFFDVVRSPVTKDRYKKRLDFFFRHVGVVGIPFPDQGAGICEGSPKRITSGPPGRLTTTCESKKSAEKGRSISGIYCP